MQDNGQTPPTPSVFPAPAASSPFSAPASSSPVYLSPDRPKKSKKKLIIIIVLALLIISVGVGVFILTQVSPSLSLTPKEEASKLTEDFYDQYKSFTDAYGNITAAGEGEDALSMGITPIQGEDATKSTQEVLDATFKSYEAFNGITSRIKDASEATNLNLEASRTKAKTFLDAAQSNFDTIITFSVAFANPILEAASDTDTSSKCTLNEDAKTLLDSEKEEIATAANAYEDIYCELYQAALSKASLSQQLSANLNAARRALLRALTPVDMENIGLSELSSLRVELRL